MPLLRGVKDIQKGDIVLNVYGFTDTWDHIHHEDTDEWHLLLEICVSEVEGIFSSESNIEIEVLEYGFLYFDPRSYLGYDYYHYKNNPCSYSIESSDILGIVNGQLDLQDKYLVKTFLRKILKQYRNHIEDRYQSLLESDEEALSLSLF